MVKKNLKKILLTASCAAVLLFGSVSMCFADEASTPAHINVPATSISFEITEKINMTGTANSTDLTVDSLTVTNKSDVGVLNIASIKANPVTGWTLADQDTEWIKLNANSDTFGLVADGTHDMADGAYTGAGSINAGASDTTTFEGNVGLVTQAISDEKVADIVVTVAYQ